MKKFAIWKITESKMEPDLLWNESISVENFLFFAIPRIFRSKACVPGNPEIRESEINKQCLGTALCRRKKCLNSIIIFFSS